MVAIKILKDLADIHSGYGFRKAISASPVGKILVVQAKDIRPNENLLNTDILTRTAFDIPRSNSYLQQDDVLLVSRGLGNYRSTVNKSPLDNIVASASLFVIRVKNDSISPDYLSLYLNGDEGQSQLSQITTGAYIRNITRGKLEKVTIPLPSSAQQEYLVSLQQNIRQQEKLRRREIQLKSNIANATLAKIVKG